MKKLPVFFLAMMLFLQHGQAQQPKQIWIEDFDDSISFVATPTGSWRTNTVYHLPSTSQNSPKSYQGLVPNLPGDSTILETPQYNCTNYSHVLLRFFHICKISPKDTVRIEYRTISVAAGPWRPLPANTYLGNATNFSSRGFNSGSYPEWNANNNLALPDASWWREELFDLWFQASYQTVQFRFIIKHGTEPGTQAAYGWLLENFQLIAAIHPLCPPMVQLVPPLVKDTAYSTGPWEINAKVKTNTTARIATPLLKYKAVNGAQIDTGTVLMTHVQGDSLWKASIPQFIVGTKVSYSIEGWDTLGNTAFAFSEYTIAMAIGVKDYVYFGAADSLTGAAPQSLVLAHGQLNSWSRHIYLNSELKNIPYKDPVLINNIAYRMSGLSTINRTTIRIYLKATKQTTMPMLYANPVSDGATLVYEGPMNFVYPGWIDIPFDTSFLLPTGNNLMVYVEDHTATSSGIPDPNFTLMGWQASGTNTNTSVFGESHFTGTATAYSAKPVTRFNIGYPDYGINSASLHAIDILDTVEVFPNTTVPIIATIRNRGTANLNSITASYILNSNTVVTKTINLTTPLTWDICISDTLGYYLPTPNGLDTFTVWVSNPNGMPDDFTFDDTLQKTIYGRGAIIMKFVQAPEDTTYMIKSSKITAEITIVSTGATVDSAFLFVTTTIGGISNNDTLRMQPIGSNQWTTTIAAQPYGTNVEYNIQITDSRGNDIVLAGNYYNKGIIGKEGYIVIGDSTTSGNIAPISYAAGYGAYSHSRQLYKGTEINASGGGSLITKFAWNYATSIVGKYERQRCYFRAVDFNTLVAAYTNPITDGADLVWSGTIEFTAQGWMDIEMEEPFYLPAGKNLLIYWENEHGTALYNPVWRYTSVPNSVVYEGWFSSFAQAITRAALSNNRPNLRLYLYGRSGMEHSAALIDIQPKKSATAGNTPVVITLQNKGIENLTTCEVNWTINGNMQVPTTYYGNLFEEYTDTMTIGYYTPTAIGDKDTIVVWLSLPNGEVDSITLDDTLTVHLLGCTSILSGTVTVGSGKDFETIDDVLDAIRNCGVSGDVTLELDGFFSNVDLSHISEDMEGYRLTITSLGNNPNNAIIRPVSGAGITLSQSHNITIQSITVDVSYFAIPAPAIQFLSPCIDVTIRDCKLLADTTTTTNTPTNSLIFKGAGTGMLDKVSFINNLLSGGYYGIYLDGGAGAQYGNFVFDSNKVSNQCERSIFIQYADASCSHNTIESRFSSNTAWTAFHLTFSRGQTIGNRIIQRSNTISASKGIYFENYAGSTNIGLIANNEIRLFGNAIGIDCRMNAYGDIIHNSIYIAGNGTARGIDVNNGSSGGLSIQNNNIVVMSSSAYPVYAVGQYNLNVVSIMDYNNLYAPDYVGFFFNTSLSTMEAWRQRTGKDLNSVRVLPTFIDVTNNLKLTNNRGLYCYPTITPPVDEDIEKQSRTDIWLTTMGCYEDIPTANVNAALIEIIGLRSGEVLGETDSIKVLVFNTGATLLDSITLEWSINGVSQGTSSHSILLNKGQSVVISPGLITYPVGNAEIKVWINDLGYLTDEYSIDDTVAATISVCPSGGFNGVVTIGQNKDFPTIKQAYDALIMCGVSGNVTFTLESGIYDERLDLTNSIALFGNNSFTITSATNNTDDVIIRTISGWGIRLANTNNFTLKDITIDAATYGTNAIEFAGACTNIVVKDCKLLATQTATTNTYNPIYKPANTGIVSNISFISNVLDGGYHGFYFYGGTGTTTYGNNVVFENNTLSNQHAYGVYAYYANFASFSDNSIISRTSNSENTWTGISMSYSNGDITRNSIIQKDTAIAKPSGLKTASYNSNAGVFAFIANNEIILNSDDIGYGINVENTLANILHNSVYISGIGAARGIHITNAATSSNNINIKNNNFVMLSSDAYPIYFSDINNLNRYDIDYNNLSAPVHAGYYGGDKDLPQWQQDISTDQNSVNVSPTFANPSINLELSTYNSAMLSPRLEVKTDIKSIARPPFTTMGAYEKLPDGCDLMLWQVFPSKEKVVHQESISVEVEISNNGTVVINSAVFGWSINGTIQQPSVNHIFTTPFVTLEKQIIPIGVFATDANFADHFEVVVWLESVNGISNLDTIKWNDTVQTIYLIQPLAEWVYPVTKGVIINQLSFDVYAKIQTETGAPITPPQLDIETHFNGNTILDSVPMTLINGVWTATVPQQYYNSEIIYSLTVLDLLGNGITLKDTVYPQIDYALLKSDSITIGTGTTLHVETPIVLSRFFGNNWSRQIYLYNEVCPDLNPDGKVITKIAWEWQGTNDFFDNQTCYMRAIDNAVEATGYLNPSLATQVWGPARLNVSAGWVEIVLNTPFYLPYGKNLQVIWENRSNKIYSLPNTGWRATATTGSNRTIYASGAAFPNTATGILNVNRPNIKITKENAFEYYRGHNLALVSMIPQVYDATNLCEGSSYLPVKIILENMGEREYNFSVDSIAIGYEMIDPLQKKHNDYMSISIGKLKPKTSDTFELVLPIMYAGRYDVKAFVVCPLDNYKYDDTNYLSFTSGRIGLPFEEYFTAANMPFELISSAFIGTEKWEVYHPSPTFPVQPNSNGTNMLRYAGARGDMSRLVTRPLDLYETINARLEFLYYHDTLSSALDDSYTDVNILIDGMPSRLYTVHKRDGNHGWQMHSIPLSSYPAGQCVQIQFESMNKSDVHTEQYIDYIFITSEQDLEVSEILVSPQTTVCDLQDKEISVVIRTTTNHTIDFTQYPTSLIVEVSGYQPFIYPLQGSITGNTIDTILIPSKFNFKKGMNTVKAYLITPVDNVSANDTAAPFNIDINPALEVTVLPITNGNTNCLIKGSQIHQDVRVKNTGNMDISEIGIKLEIDDERTTPQIIRKTVQVNLPPNKDTVIDFFYTVPSEAYYYVDAKVALTCDSTLANHRMGIRECVDMEDLSIELLKPEANTTDIIGASNDIQILVINAGVSYYQNIIVTARIEDENGNLIDSIEFKDVISTIEPLDSVLHTFSKKHIVPNKPQYILKVFIENKDNYPKNDTIKELRSTKEVGVISNILEKFVLSQNIPNPAKNNTMIEYSIPSSGEVVFKIQSVSGQVLHTQTLQSDVGKHFIELNTSDFAAGIYFYSMEYKGQKIVKRMSVKK